MGCPPSNYHTISAGLVRSLCYSSCRQTSLRSRWYWARPRRLEDPPSFHHLHAKTCSNLVSFRQIAAASRATCGRQGKHCCTSTAAYLQFCPNVHDAELPSLQLLHAFCWLLLLLPRPPPRRLMAIHFNLVRRERARCRTSVPGSLQLSPSLSFAALRYSIDLSKISVSRAQADMLSQNSPKSTSNFSKTNPRCIL